MFRACVMGLVFLCVPTLLFASEAGHHPPSDGAQDMPGATGTFSFKPDDWQKGVETWWVDTDGVDPAVPGCHIGLEPGGKEHNGRFFGEACLESGLLVESNPGAGEVHAHRDDVGHPDTFDCNRWCQGKGFAEVGCERAPAPAPCEVSARCTCR